MRLLLLFTARLVFNNSGVINRALYFEGMLDVLLRKILGYFRIWSAVFLVEVEKRPLFT